MDDDEELEVVDTVTDDKATDDYLNDILTESQEIEEEPEEFEKNKEGVTGDEWEEEEKERLEKEENRRNAERRIREKKEKEKEVEEKEEEEDDYIPDDKLDAAELEAVKANYEEMSKKLEVATPVMKYLIDNKIGDNELKFGVDFVNHWRADKVGAVKVLVNALAKEGINVGQILDHDDRQFDVMRQVNQQVQPVIQEREMARRQAESKELLDGFLTKYPDAWEHLEEITQVMQKTGVRDPYDAYFRLRRVYRDNNEPWKFNNSVEEEYEPPIVSPRADTYQDYQPQSYRDIGDVVAAEARKYFRR